MPLSLRAASPLVLCLALGACASNDSGPPPPAYVGLTPTEQFAIEVRQTPDEIRLAPNSGGLSPTQEAAIADLSSRWRANGGGVITIQAPASANAGPTVEASRGVLITLGASPEEVRVVSYQPPQGAPAAVIVGYAGYQAVGPQCGVEWENLASDRDNTVHRNYGCSVTANLANQIANPRDLLRPRAMDPADATRRSVVLDKYRKGEATSSAKDPQADATLSEATKD